MLRHRHTHKGTLRDTGPHAQALPAARIVNTTGLCSDLRLQLPASLSRLSSSQVLSCPTPASCLALALARSRDQSLLHPFICPLAFAQAPGSRMAIAPFSQMPTQPNFTPRSGGRPAGLVAARLGHHGGGGGREPGSCSGRKESSPSCHAGLPGKLQASSSPSHPPSAGLRLLTSEMRQYPCPSDMSTQYIHRPDNRSPLPSLPLFYLYNNSNIYLISPVLDCTAPKG